MALSCGAHQLNFFNRYMLACLNKSKSIIECGTSFGISTVYLALAIQQNVLSGKPETEPYGVLTMEKDPKKLEEAKQNWAVAGPEVEAFIHPLEGDLLHLLEKHDGLPETVDFLFLDGKRSPF